MAIDKFGRDPGISEIVRYYDIPEHSAWHLLTDSEAKVLHGEIARCADRDTGYKYIAKNYYWIENKDVSGATVGDTLLKFKDTQEMVWETIRLLRLRGRQVKIVIVKGRQLYISSFCIGLLAYETQFNPNNRGLLVSYDEGHAAKLFGRILHIYDQLPWWLRPMVGARKYEEGIHLINPDPELRRLEPGLNSRITVQGANQTVGVSEGETVNTAVLSEFGSYVPGKARKIIMGDFRWALPDSPSTTAILETRVQRASKFVERFWESMVELGDDADWYPMFIPIYFDKSHFIAPRAGWKPQKPELQVKERAAEEWCACSNCGQLRPTNFGGGNMAGIPCRDCATGMYVPYTLQDGQMRWLEHTRVNAEKIGEVAVMEMQQSLATNPQEAFANVTETVFSKQARDWVAATTRGGELARGYMASDGSENGKGVFHAPRKEKFEHTAKTGEPYGQESAQCYAPGCKIDHTGETERYLKIWQFPQKGCKYGMGVDVAAGGGRSADYSYILVAKLGQLPAPDMQVAAYRCNTISAWHLADLANSIGRWYNNALAVVDYSNYQTTGDRLLNFFHYPNIYQWINPDSIKQTSNKWHWIWQFKNKESGWQVLDGWLRDQSFIVKDPVLAKEIRHFQRLPDGTLGAPDSKDDDGLGNEFERVHDDSVMACISLVIASHQQDPRKSENFGADQTDGLRKPGEWIGICTKCTKEFPAQVPGERDRCPYCQSIWLKWRMPKLEGPIGVGKNAILGFEFSEMGGAPGPVRDRQGAPEDFSFGYGSGLPEA